MEKPIANGAEDVENNRGRELCLSPRGPIFRLGLSFYTDEGLTGLGEAILMGRSGSFRATLTEMGEIVVGMDPMASENVWWRLFLGDRRRGGPLTASAIGAIDVAIWDIRGQPLGVPIHTLLGGLLQDSVRMYYHAVMPEPAAVADALGPLLEEGWAMAKFIATPSRPHRRAKP